MKIVSDESTHIVVLLRKYGFLWSFFFTVLSKETVGGEKCSWMGLVVDSIPGWLQKEGLDKLNQRVM